MSSLIFMTAVLPFGLGIVVGLIALAAGARPLLLWLIVAATIVVLYVLLEGVPPFPPIASKQRLGYVIALACLVAPVVRLKPLLLGIVSAILLGAAYYWIAGTKLMGAPLPDQLWLLPLPLVLAVGVALHRRERPAGDAFYASRLGLLCAATASSVVALIGGFVGLGQLQGAFAALIGGTLTVSYGARLIGRGLVERTAFSPAAEWAAWATLAAMVLISAAFTPTPQPLALYAAAAAYLAPALIPISDRLAAALRPFVPGLTAAIPAGAAVAIALLSRA